MCILFWIQPTLPYPTHLNKKKHKSATNVSKISKTITTPFHTKKSTTTNTTKLLDITNFHDCNNDTHRDTQKTNTRPSTLKTILCCVSIISEYIYRKVSRLPVVCCFCGTFPPTPSPPLTPCVIFYCSIANPQPPPFAASQSVWYCPQITPHPPSKCLLVGSSSSRLENL